VRPLVYPVVEAVFRVLFTYDCIGEEKIPASGPAVIAANHPSYLDPILLGLQVRRPIHFMAWDALFRVPLLGGLMRLFGAFPVDVRRGKGNEAYARDNRTYGLTTLRDRHAVIEGGAVSFRFAGKGGRRHELTVEDPRLARLVRRCRDIPGQQLLQWVDDDGTRHPLSSEDVNQLLRDVTGLPVSAKAFRTWHASVRAAALLAVADPPTSARQANSVVCDVVDEVASELGNTRAVCRASYVHPSVVASYEEGVLAEWWHDGPTRAAGRCTAEERRLLVLLRKARRRGLGVTRAKRSVRRAAKTAPDTAAA